MTASSRTKEVRRTNILTETLTPNNIEMKKTQKHLLRIKEKHTFTWFLYTIHEIYTYTRSNLTVFHFVFHHSVLLFVLVIGLLLVWPVTCAAICKLPTSNNCTECLGSPGIIHDRTPDCHPVSWAWMHK